MPRLLACALAGWLIGASPLWAQARVEKVGRVPVAEILRYAGKLGRKATPYLELLALADEVTTREGGVVVRTAGKPALESLHLEARFRLRVEVEDYLTNAVLFAEFPGRRVWVRLRADCLVHCTLDLGGFRVERDRDYPDTVVVRLPPMEVRATLPPDVEKACRVDYGRLRTRWFDADRADALRQKLARAARERAEQEFTAAALPAYRVALAREVQRQLRARYPRLRVYVDPPGLILVPRPLAAPPAGAGLAPSASAGPASPARTRPAGTAPPAARTRPPRTARPGGAQGMPSRGRGR
jgi:hypothetical protein